MEVRVLDFGYVRLVESWGSDERIIEAARMSTSGGFKGWGPVHETPDACHAYPEHCRCELKPGDEKLLRYLWTHKHMTPFEMAGATIEMQLPIFVARELIRHRTLSTNELSARYVELPNICYIPSIERIMAGRQSAKNKQGSEEGFTTLVAGALQEKIKQASIGARLTYETLLEMSMSRELARVVVPVNTYTRWRQSGNLRNWLQMLALRLPDNVQWETREYARALSQILESRFPRTYYLFAEDNEDA